MSFRYSGNPAIDHFDFHKSYHWIAAVMWIFVFYRMLSHDPPALGKAIVWFSLLSEILSANTFPPMSSLARNR